MAGTNLIFYFFLFLPFQFALFSVDGSDIPLLRILIPLFFFAWLLRGLALKKVILPRTITFFAFTSFLVWAMLSVFWAENTSWSLAKVIFWLNFFPLFLMLSDILEKREVKIRALEGLVFGGCAVAVIGILQFLTQFFVPLQSVMSFSMKALYFFLGSNFAGAVASYPSVLVNIEGATLLRAFAFFPDPHIFAYYCSMVFPLAVYMALYKKKNRFAVLAPFVLLMAVVLSFSRASYIALFVTILLFGVTFLWERKKNISVLWPLFGIAVSIVIFLSPAADRFMSSFSHTDGSVVERSRLWQEAIINIEKNPFHGVGLGNYPLLVKPSAEPREPIYVHNLYLDIAVELGLVGLFLFLLFILTCLPRISLSLNTKNSFVLALYGSLLIFLTHSLFEYPLFSIHIVTLLLTILSFLYVEKQK